jgi:hypothetical protein
VEWAEVVTEGKDIEECRVMLRDALDEMIQASKELGKEIPLGNALIEQLPVEGKGHPNCTPLTRGASPEYRLLLRTYPAYNQREDSTLRSLLTC